jgi:hypothetical protein
VLLASGYYILHSSVRFLPAGGWSPVEHQSLLCRVYRHGNLSDGRAKRPHSFSHHPVPIKCLSGGVEVLSHLCIFPNCWRDTCYAFHIVTYTGLAWIIIMGSGFDDWVYWHFYTITLNYYSSQSILTAEASLHSASRSATLCTSLLLRIHWMRCVGNRVFIPKQRVGFLSVYNLLSGNDSFAVRCCPL